MTITLEGGCTGSPECAELAERTYKQLAAGRYEYPCSLLELPANMDSYLEQHRTTRKRAARAARLGYRFDVIDRTRHEADVFAINTSTPERQGRPMSAGYTQPVAFSPLSFTCSRHAVNTYGVLDGQGRLRAYAWVYRVGELVMFSSILGHAADLARDVMYLLVSGTLRRETENGHGVAFYNRHDSGTDGLRYFKERLGFRPGRAEWRLA